MLKLSLYTVSGKVVTVESTWDNAHLTQYTDKYQKVSFDVATFLGVGQIYTFRSVKETKVQGKELQSECFCQCLKRGYHKK
jgi:MFS-type transporter involved in bile tolerance (Atg22 family)